MHENRVDQLGLCSVWFKSEFYCYLCNCLTVSSCWSVCVFERRPKLSAKSSLSSLSLIVHVSHHSSHLWSPSSTSQRKKNGNSRQPCFTPVLTLKLLDSWPTCKTLHEVLHNIYIMYRILDNVDEFCRNPIVFQ